MAKFRKYLFRTVAIILGVFVTLFIIVFIYVSVNKQKIIRQVTSDISKKLDGKVSIGNVELSFFRNFPKIGVLLHDVSITDTMFSQHNHAFFKAEEVFARLSVYRLIKKQSPLNGIKIINASIYMYTDSAGYTNEYLFKPKKDSTAKTTKSSGENELGSVELDHVRFTIDNRKREKLHDFMVNKLSIDLDDDVKVASFSVNADIFVHSLAFNLPRGIFLKEKKFTGSFDMRFDKQLKQLQFDSINVNIGGQRFNTTGRFDLSGTAPQFSFRLHTKDALYPTVKSLLPERISKSLSIVDLDKPIDAHTFISGPLRGGDPYIYITWEAKNTSLKTPFMDFDSASFTGYFTDEVVAGLPRKDPNSRIVINNFAASWHGLPVRSANIDILDLSTPTLTCDMQSNFPLSSLNELTGINSLQLQAGDAAVDITYKGPIEKNDKTNSFLNGSVIFKNGTILYTPRDVQLEQVNGSMAFNNSDLIIDSIQAVVLNNKILMNGQARNLLTLINTQPNAVNLDWNIYSPSLNLNAFNFLLKSRKKVTRKTAPNHALSKMASGIDEVLDQGKLNVSLKTDKLIYKKFIATNVLANISLLQDSYLINNVSMNHAGGKMSMNGSLSPQRTNYLQARLNVKMDNVNVTSVFHAFDNFGQSGITSESLAGQLSAKANASFGLDQNGTIYPSSMAGNVDFSLKNGELNNYEPIKKIQRFIFKKRDFDNIRFAELKDKLEINNGDIKINRMEIQSSVLSLFVEGLYSQKGATDMSIQVPLSNMKKRDADYNPENLGADKKGGRSIYIRGRPGSDGNINFSLDLFNKFKKAKKKKEEKAAAE